MIRYYKKWGASLLVIGLTLMVFTACTNNDVNNQESGINLSEDDIEIEEDVEIDSEVEEGPDENIEHLFEEESYEFLMGIALSYKDDLDYEASMLLTKRLLEVYDDQRLKINLYDCYTYLGDYEEEKKALLEENIELYEAVYDGLSFSEKSNYNYNLILSGDNQKAIDNYLVLVEETEDENRLESLYNNISWAYVNIGDYENAIIYSKKSLEIEIDSTTLTNLGNSYYGLGQYQDAADTFEQAHELNPNNTYAIYGLANTYGRLDEDEKSLEFWILYTEVQPNDMDGWSTLFRRYKEDNIEEAIKVLETILTLSDDSQYYWRELYKLYDLQGQTELRDNLLLEYRTVHGDYAADLLYAQEIFKVDGQEGFVLYTALIEKHQPSIWDFSNLYMDFYYQEDPMLEKLIVLLDQAYGKEERLKMIFEYADDYYELELIVEIGEELVSIDKADAYVYSSIAYAYKDLGDNEKAIESYALSLELEMNEYIASSLVELYIDMAYLDEAKQLLAQSKENAVSYFYMDLQQARLYMLEGLEEEAMISIRSAFDLSTSTRYYLGDYKEFETLDLSEFESEE